MRKAWLMWTVGVGAYVVAVLHRTSFGVAGLAAADRFDATAKVLATFMVFQLIVYAALQLPVGVLLDRFGARILVGTGALLMAAGQLTLALATTLPTAIAGRAMVGAGDAMTFICVLRVVSAWFPDRHAALLIQLTGLLGQLGQLLSAIPLAAILVRYGWQPAFGSAAALGILVAIVSLAVLRDGPPGTVPRTTNPSLVQDFLATWRNPGVRLGFWSHFATMFSNVTFTIMWGFPFLMAGQGRALGYASALMTLIVLSSAAVSPFAGVMVGRHPDRRVIYVLTVVAVTALAWTVALSWPGQIPTWMLVLLALAMAAGGPGSMIGFDFARTSSTPQRLGTATGLVNIGGFSAALIAILAIGFVLDLNAGDQDPLTLGRFRAAMLVQYPLWALGVWGVVHSYSRVVRSEGVDRSTDPSHP